MKNDASDISLLIVHVIDWLTQSINWFWRSQVIKEVAFFPLNLTRDRWDDKIGDCDAIRITNCPGHSWRNIIFLSEPKRIQGKQKALFNFNE